MLDINNSFWSSPRPLDFFLLIIHLNAAKVLQLLSCLFFSHSDGPRNVINFKFSLRRYMVIQFQPYCVVLHFCRFIQQVLAERFGNLVYLTPVREKLQTLYWDNEWQYVSVKCVADSNFHRDKNWTTGLKLFLYYSEEYREIVVILGRSSEAMQISKSVMLSFICSSRIWPRIYILHFTLQRFSCSQYVFLQIFWVF